MNESVREWFRYHTDFLYTKIFEHGLFYLDFWSLVHTWSALVVFTLVISVGIKNKWFWFTFIIVVYELIEVLFIYIALHIFRPERINDQIMDIIVGLSVGLIWNYILIGKTDKQRVVSLPIWFFKIFSACTFSFVWVGNYHYQYNIEALNNRGINFWTFSMWLIGGYIFLNLYEMMKSRYPKMVKHLIMTWLAYFILLLMIEFVGYYILEIREDSSNSKRPLIFGLIHGTLAMHIYYMIFPFLIIPFYEIFRKQVANAQLKLFRIKNNQTQCISALNEI